MDYVNLTDLKKEQAFLEKLIKDPSVSKFAKYAHESDLTEVRNKIIAYYDAVKNSNLNIGNYEQAIGDPYGVEEKLNEMEGRSVAYSFIIIVVACLATLIGIIYLIF